MLFVPGFFLILPFVVAVHLTIHSRRLPQTKINRILKIVGWIIIAIGLVALSGAGIIYLLISPHIGSGDARLFFAGFAMFYFAFGGYIAMTVGSILIIIFQAIRVHASHKIPESNTFEGNKISKPNIL
jgi:hypothetical protein